MPAFPESTRYLRQPLLQRMSDACSHRSNLAAARARDLRFTSSALRAMLTSALVRNKFRLAFSNASLATTSLSAPNRFWIFFNSFADFSCFLVRNGSKKSSRYRTFFPALRTSWNAS